MNASFLLIYIILIGLYNISLNISRRKGKLVGKSLIYLQVAMNLILVVWGLAYLFLG
ncbi:hypothetical protein JZO70_07355 [Enterococcus sp. 669A]|uniref:Uncharacterized protein n=1 Tax=Candidatus Enterococcus moelleringii TaxID=2815325 RepID=A0ABS3LB53_9ENTE|nr:hypothetical protein [Enterococcus sp. 669A]MBO1305971.1 hypothetical protein [Enterococcus sp. 669A]